MANIFVVDDEPLLLDLMSSVLRMEGHHVYAFSDPLAALEYFRAQQPAVDLLLTDVQMKPITGNEVASVLIQKGFSGPIIFTSGYPSAGFPGLGAGPHLALDKPFTAAGLRSTVANALAADNAKTHHAI